MNSAGKKHLPLIAVLAAAFFVLLLAPLSAAADSKGDSDSGSDGTDTSGGVTIEVVPEDGGPDEQGASGSGWSEKPDDAVEGEAEPSGAAAAEKEPSPSYKLGEVEIAESREPTTTVVTAEDIERHDDRALNEILDRVPGVRTKKAGKGHDRISMRGYETEMIGLVIDGIPVHDLYRDNLDFSLFPVFNSSEVRILRGPVSAVYGTDAAVGLVEVKSGIPDGFVLDTAFSMNPANLDFRILLNHEYLINRFYYKIGGVYYNEKGFATPDSLTSELRREWMQTLVNTKLYGDTYQDLISTVPEAGQYAASEDPWRDVFSRGLHLTAKAGGFISDNIDTGVSFAFSDNRKRSLSYRRDYLSSYNPASEEWSDPSLSDAVIPRNFEWPLFQDWYVTPYFEYQGSVMNIRSNLYWRRLKNTVIWSGNYSNWLETTIGGRANVKLDLAGWNSLTVALFGWNDWHRESEEYYTTLPSTPLSDYIGGVRPPDDEVPNEVPVKDLAGLQAALALEDRLTFWRFDITLACSYDFQYFYKSMGESGVWEEVSPGKWKYNLTSNDVSSEGAVFLGTRDALNPTARIEFSIIEDTLSFITSGSIKTKFPTLRHYYADYTPDAEDRITELSNQVSYNANGGLEYTPIKDRLSFRLDGFFTSYDNKIESYYNADTGDFEYYNIDMAYSTGFEAVGRFAFEAGGFFTFTGKLGYTFCMGIQNAYTYPRFEYLPAHEILADTEASFYYGDFATKIMTWARFSAGAVTYIMNEAPAPEDPFSADYFTAVPLNNAFVLNVKLTQELPLGFSVSATLENIFDSYGIDPFNPLPARSITFAAEYHLEF